MDNAYVVFCGRDGQAILFGTSESEPKVGEAFRLENARMIIRFTNQGIFGLAARGPVEGDRISVPVPWVSDVEAKSVIPVPPEAADKIAEWAAL